MKAKTAVATLALALLPALAMAEGCHDRSQISASSCMEGHVWDETKGACVPQPSS